MSKYAENMRKTMRISARRKKEIKKEFQDYLNNSCDRLREEKKTNDISSEKVNGRRSKED